MRFLGKLAFFRLWLFKIPIAKGLSSNVQDADANILNNTSHTFFLPKQLSKFMLPS